MAASNRYEAKGVDASSLGQPLAFAFSKKTAPNRFLKAAMTERLASWDPKDFPKRGIPTKELINVYRRWGEGGYGVILSGNIMIKYDQLEAAGNTIIPLDAPFSGERFEGFKEMATQAKKHGMLFVGQLSHPGRQTEIRLQPNPVSASDVQLEGTHLGMNYGKPRAATQEDINQIIEGFAHASEYLEKAGFDGIEVHGAHGYLISQFLSPDTNRRTDKYGGSVENRARIIVEIIQAIQKRVSKDFIIGIKLNSVEFQDKGFTTEDAKNVCAILEANKFDFVELSGGTYEEGGFAHRRESTKKREAFFLEWADMITPALSKTRVYVTGGFRTVAAMVDGLKSVHGIGLARPATQEPRLPNDILAGKVNASINQLTDDDDFGLTNVASGTQIRQMSKDQEPIDLSRKENLDVFYKDMGAWGEKLKNNKDLKEYGYIDLGSFSASPYGKV